MKNLTIILLLFSITASSQVEIDVNVDTASTTERYVDYSDQLLIKVMSVVKKNELELVNTNNLQSLKLAPLGMSSLGFGFNYKWLGLGIAFGLPASSADIEKYGETQRFDFQLNIYSKKFVIDAFAQRYSGFHVKNPTELDSTWTETFFPKRDSMGTFSLGVGGYYVFNSEKLSYKAAYVRNAVQKKSGGSFLLGAFYNLDNAGFEDGATSHFVPDYFSTEIQDTFPINAYTATSFGISFGYTYTLVFFKRFFINISLIPGIGGKNLTVFKSNGEKVEESGGAARFIGRTALGYENKHFLMGLTTYSTTGSFDFENYKIKPSTSNVKFFIAKRFNLKKKQ